MKSLRLFFPGILLLLITLAFSSCESSGSTEQNPPAPNGDDISDNTDDTPEESLWKSVSEVYKTSNFFNQMDYYSVKMKRNNSNQAIVAWVEEKSFESANDSNTVWANIYSDGTWGTPTKLGNDRSQLEDVAIDSDGNAIVLWVYSERFSSNDYLKTSKYNAATKEWSFLANIHLDYTTDPKIAVDADNRYYILWKEYNAPGYDLKVKTYYNDTWSTETVITSNLANYAARLALEASRSNECFAVWIDETFEATAGADVTNVWYSKYTGSGWTTPARISQDRTGTEYSAGLLEIEMNSKGDTVIGWYDNGDLSNPDKIHTRTIAGSSGTMSAAQEWLVSTDSTAGHPFRLKVNEAGVAAICYINYPANEMLYGMVDISTGNTTGPTVIPNDNDYLPIIKVNSNDSFTLMYENMYRTARYRVLDYTTGLSDYGVISGSIYVSDYTTFITKYIRDFEVLTDGTLLALFDYKRSESYRTEYQLAAKEFLPE